MSCDFYQRLQFNSCGFDPEYHQQLETKIQRLDVSQKVTEVDIRNVYSVVNFVICIIAAEQKVLKTLNRFGEGQMKFTCEGGDAFSVHPEISPKSSMSRTFLE